jgi:hypothetical protein
MVPTADTRKLDKFILISNRPMFQLEFTVYFYCRWGKDGWLPPHQLIPIVPRRRRRTGPNKRSIIRRCPANATPVIAAMIGKMKE